MKRFMMKGLLKWRLPLVFAVSSPASATIINDNYKALMEQTIAEMIPEPATVACF